MGGDTPGVSCRASRQLAARETEEILVGKTAKTKDYGVEHEFVMYEKAFHGFAVRADEDNVEEAERGKKAEAQAIAWFARWFAEPPPKLSGGNA